MENDMPKFSALPKYTPNAEDSVLAQDEAREPSPKKLILLVEDYESNIFLISLYLEGLGYEYEIARNGVEAFEKSKSRKYDVILMDVQMPDLNGIDATKLIRKYEIEENLTPIIIIGLTAHALSGDREYCLAAGMDDYLAKPLSLDLLKIKLTNYIEISKLKP